eukprot:12190235-Alexandrium_andersonii.AAC.1
MVAEPVVLDLTGSSLRGCSSCRGRLGRRKAASEAQGLRRRSQPELARVAVLLRELHELRGPELRGAAGR